MSTFLFFFYLFFCLFTVFQFQYIKEIGESLHHDIISRIKDDYEKELRLRELEIIESYSKENQVSREAENTKFQYKCNQVKVILKKEYDKLLQVF